MTKYGQISVTTTAAIIFGEPANTKVTRIFQNQSASVSVGIAPDPGVTMANAGIILAPGQFIELTDMTGSWYAICASSATLGYTMIIG
jgi:hypothetical protein